MSRWAERLSLRNMKYRHQLRLLMFIFIMFTVTIELFYYFRFSEVVAEKESRYNQMLFEEAGARLENLVNGVKGAADNIVYKASIHAYLQADPASQNKSAARIAIYDLMQLCVDTVPYISGITFVDSDETISSHGGTGYISYITLSEFYDVLSLSKSVFTPILYEYKDTSDREAYAYYITPIKTPPGIRNSRSGALIISIKLSKFMPVVDNSSFTENSAMLLIDSGHSVVLRSDNGENYSDSDIEQIIAENPQNRSEVTINGKRHLVLNSYNDFTGWRMVSIIPYADMNAGLLGIQLFALLVGMISLGLFVMLVSVFSRVMNRPIESLVGHLREYGDGSTLSTRIPFEAGNEISVITGEINTMLDKIESLTLDIVAKNNRLFEMRLNEKEAQLTALQSQINPHFLYNTLECIRSIAIVHGIPAIVTIAEGMCDIFQTSISDGFITTIGKEMEIVKSYANIMTIRFNGRIRFAFTVEPQILDRKIIKMLLQPLVENAVYHGLENITNYGEVAVEGRLEGGVVVFEVRDNGAGIDPAVVQAMNASFRRGENYAASNNRHMGLGLSNINKRVQLQFGDNFGLHISSTPGAGTVVRIELCELPDEPVSDSI